jgi:hypothetical protein
LEGNLSSLRVEREEAMPTSLMDCPECERLREEEDKAILLFKGANTELQAALESLDPNATLDLGQWKRLML